MHLMRCEGSARKFGISISSYCIALHITLRFTVHYRLALRGAPRARGLGRADRPRAVVDGRRRDAADDDERLVVDERRRVLGTGVTVCRLSTSWVQSDPSEASLYPHATTC